MSPNTNLLLLAALGAGGLWLYKDHEKRRPVRRVQPETSPVTPVRGPVPPREPAARHERIRLAPRSYDAIFAEHGHGVPVAYLRALALHESDLNPRLVDRGACGLLQVVEIVRRDYNRKHNTSYERRDLLDPAVNVAVASSVLARIVDGYEKFHPEATNLREDWHNPLFVELLTLGWNGGFSERAGVGRVATTLTARGFDDFTIDDVHAAARQPGVSPNLGNPKKVAFAKKVTTQYLRERARDQAEGYQPDAAPPPVVAKADEPVSQPSQVDPGPVTTPGGVA